MGLAVLALGVVGCGPNDTTDNQAPVADAGSDEVARVGTVVTVDGTRSEDQDGDPLSFALAVASGPPGASAALADADTATPTLTPAVPGTYVVTLTVSDGASRASDTVSVTGQDENVAPVLSGIEGQRTPMGVAIDVPLTLADEEPDGVTVDATSDDASLIPDDAIESRGGGRTRTLHITPATFGIGTVRISVVVRDPEGLQDDGAFDLTLTAPFDTPRAKHALRERTSGDNVGSVVALDGDSAIVGAQYDSANGKGAGAAHIFERTDGVLEEAARLLAADGAAGDDFGASVAIDGDYAVVGAPHDDGRGIDAGEAYVFFRASDGWRQVATLPPTGPVVTAASAPLEAHEPVVTAASTSLEARDHVGLSVAISGRHVLVGATGDDDAGDRAGAAYLYERCPPRTFCESPWYEIAKLVPDPDLGVGGFGSAVALAGTEALIGVPYADKGAVYAFHQSAGTWQAYDVLYSPGTGNVTDFGAALALRGSHAIAGAPREQGGGADAGAAYALALANGAWRVTGALVGDPPAPEFARFGSSVALGEVFAVVGAPFAGGADHEVGAADVFQRSGDAWTHVRHLSAADAASLDQFGQAVAMADDSVFVGAPGDDGDGGASGSVYVFHR